MKLIGQFAPSTRSEVIVGWAMLVVLCMFLLPWIAIAVGCILAGIVAIQRGEYSLMICLPAGVALLVLPTLLFYLDCRWYRRISEFILENSHLTYKTSRETISVPIGDVRWVSHRMRHGKTKGYLVKFRDGSGIFVCRSLSNADTLASVLTASASGKSKGDS